MARALQATKDKEEEAQVACSYYYKLVRCPYYSPWHC